MNFGERLKNLRQKQGFTQKQFADILNISATCLNYWEKGKRTPDFEKLIKIAEFFNVSVDYLLCRTEKSTSNEETELLNIFRQLTAEGKEKIKIYADDISKIENYRSRR